MGVGPAIDGVAARRRAGAGPSSSSRPLKITDWLAPRRASTNKMARNAPQLLGAAGQPFCRDFDVCPAPLDGAGLPLLPFLWGCLLYTSDAADE